MLTSETVELSRKVPPVLLTATDAAVALATDADEIDDLIAAREIDVIRANGRIRVTYDSLIGWVNRKREQESP